MLTKTQRAIAAIEKFLTSPLAELINPTSSVTEVLGLFKMVAETVPAYQNFLADHKIDPGEVKTIADFEQLPLITKSNYLQKYSLDQLCSFGDLSNCDMIAVSSGSTGKPTFWPRFITDELAIAKSFEAIFFDSFQADLNRTLAVVCFSLGTWVGGIYSANCSRYLASKGYKVTVITPGNNKEEILRVVQELGWQFEQVVLLGYPPFLKDIIDTGIARNLDWSRYQIKMVLAGEVFSEEWRSLVGNRFGSTNLCYNFSSLYGTADAGVLGWETPLSIFIRRFLADRPDVAYSLFGEYRLPTLVQYDPGTRYFEVNEAIIDNYSEKGTLILSGNNGIPLIRYHIADNGGLISYENMMRFLNKYNVDPTINIARGIRSLPFAFIFGRSNFIVSYFGANIYPENVTVGLEQDIIKNWVTGKFVMEVLEDMECNKSLKVTVELAPNVTPTDDKKKAIAESILTQLKRLNSEFANYVPLEYQGPEIELKLTGDPEYFPLGVKHRYTR